MSTKLIYDLTLSDVADIICAHGKDDGWKVEEMEDGIDRLDWMIDEDICAEVSLVKHGSLSVLAMTVALEDDEATLDDLNAFNGNSQLVSAYLCDDHVIIVRAELCIRSAIEAFLDMAVDGVYDLIDEVDEGDADDYCDDRVE